MNTNSTKFPRLRSLLSTGLAALAMLASAQQAQANFGIASAFTTQYPSSQSFANAGCQLCHGALDQLNQYGHELQQSGLNFAGIEDNASVNVNNGTSYRNEIDANTQPGWTEGPINNIYDRISGALLPSTVLPPDNIGELDPVAVNDPPMANDDSATTLHDTAVAIDVLANDTDDGLPNPPGAISINSVLAVSDNGGTVSCNGNCTYTPPVGFVGTDSFTYDVTDGEFTSNLATVTIDVTNIAPIANDDAASTEEDVAVTIKVLENDVDPDGDTISISSFDATSANGGNVSCGTDCTYTPPVGFSGEDTFTYFITDDIAISNRGIVNIAVTAGPDTKPPVVTDPDPQANGEFDGVNLQIVATDNVAIASYSATGLPTGLTINSSGLISGRISYDAVQHPDTRSVFVTDVTVTDTSGNASTTSFDWAVIDVNRLPIALDDAASTTADTMVAVDVLANDSDADGDTLTIAVDSFSANGGTVVCTTTCDYTPAGGFTGDDSFTYTVDDGFGGSATATVNITVAVGPDVAPPVVTDPGPQINDESDAVSLQIVATDKVGVTSYTATGLPPGLSIDGEGLITGTVSFDAVLHPALSDTYPVTVTVDDAAGNTSSVIFDWTVNDVNRAPVALDDAANTPADTAVTIDVLANDTDADGDALTISDFDALSSGGGTVVCASTCDYTPVAGFAGTDSFSYSIEDGFGASTIATVTVDVGSANEPPVSDPNGPYSGTVGQPVSFDGSGSSDPDGGIVGYDWDFGDGNTGTGVSPSHTYQAAGSFTITLTVTDDAGANDTATTVAEIADAALPPVACEGIKVKAKWKSAHRHNRQYGHEGKGDDDDDKHHHKHHHKYGKGGSKSGRLIVIGRGQRDGKFILSNADDPAQIIAKRSGRTGKFNFRINGRRLDLVPCRVQVDQPGLGLCGQVDVINAPAACGVTGSNHHDDDNDDHRSEKDDD